MQGKGGKQGHGSNCDCGYENKINLYLNNMQGLYKY